MECSLPLIISIKQVSYFVFTDLCCKINVTIIWTEGFLSHKITIITCITSATISTSKKSFETTKQCLLHRTLSQTPPMLLLPWAFLKKTLNLNFILKWSSTTAMLCFGLLWIAIQGWQQQPKKTSLQLAQIWHPLPFQSLQLQTSGQICCCWEAITYNATRTQYMVETSINMREWKW